MTKTIFKPITTLILTALLMFGGASEIFAQTGFTTTNSLNNMGVQYAAAQPGTVANATFSGNSKIKRGNFKVTAQDGSVGTAAAIYYQGAINWGSRNRTSSQNASVASTSLGSWTLRWNNAAHLSNGTKADVLFTCSATLYAGAKPSGAPSTVYVPLQMVNGFYHYGIYKSTSNQKSQLVTTSSVKISTNIKILKPGTNQTVDASMSSMILSFYDLDVVDHTVKTGATDSARVSGTFSEGIGLSSGFKSPLIVSSGAAMQTVDGNTKLRPKYSNANGGSDGEKSRVYMKATPQGTTYIWYGSRHSTGDGKGMATSWGTSPVVNVNASAGTGGSIQKNGTTVYPRNGITSYSYTPSPGYIVKSLKVNGINQPVTASNMRGGTYNFPMMLSNQTIRVEFERPQLEVTKVADKKVHQKGDIVNYTIKLKNKTGGETPVEELKGRLSDLIEEATPLLENDEYTQESRNALNTAIESAQAALNNPSATSAEVRDAINRLSEAISGLVEEGESLQKMLEAKIEEATEVLNSGTYTDESRQAVETAIFLAQSLVNPTDAQIQAAIDAIEEALENLEPDEATSVDELLAALQEKITEAEGILADTSEYTDETASALQEAYDEAVSTYSAGESAGKAAIRAATEALDDAIVGMQNVDDAFDNLMSVANESLQSEDYTDESKEALRTVYEGYLSNPPSTTAEKKAAITALDAALEALETKEGDDGNSAGGNSSNSSNNAPFFAPLTNLFSAPLRAPSIDPSQYPGTFDTNVVLTEELPDHLQMIGFTARGGEVEADGNKLTFKVDVLADEEYTITIKAKVIKDDDAPVDVTNTVKAKGDYTEEKTASETIKIVRPDVSITKTVDKEKHRKDDTIHYVVKVENTGEGSWADNVVITDKDLSAGLTYKAGSITCTNDTATIVEENGFTATIPQLLGGQSATFEFDCTIDNAAVVSKDLVNKATVTYDQAEEPKEAEATSELVYDVVYEWVGAHPDKPVPGGEEGIPWGTEYTVDDTYKAGDTLKDVVDGQKGSWIFEGWDKTGTLVIKDDVLIKGKWKFIPEYDIETSVVNGTITETERDIPEGENRVITYEPNLGYQLKTLTVDGEEKDIKEYPSSYTFNDIHADHVVHAVFELIPGLKVEKTSDKEIYNAGDTVTYTIKVSQTIDGAEARDVLITDVLPEGVTLNEDSIQGDVEVVSTEARKYVVKISSLTDSVTYTYTAVTDEDKDHEELINVADAEGSNVPDPARDDNKVKSLYPKPEITKVVSNENPIYGEEITYWVTVREPQEGISIRSAVITDKLPEGIEAISVLDSSNGLEVSLDGDTFTARTPELEDEATFSFSAKVTAVEGTIINTAVLSGDKIKDISADAPITVKEPDPKLEKACSLEEGAVGDTAVYTITASSEIALVDAVIEDTLPSGIEVVEGTVKCSDENAKISVSDGKIKVEAETLAEAITITYEGKITAPGEQKNVVALTAYNFPKGPLTAEAVVIGYNPKPIIEKEVSDESVKIGETVSYHITARSEKGTIYNAVIKDTLPSGINLDEGSITCSREDAKIDATGEVITVMLETLGEEPVEITYEAEVTETGEQTNIVTLSGDNTDGEAEAEATVEGIPNPSVKTGDNASLPFALTMFFTALVLLAIFVTARRLEDAKR